MTQKQIINRDSWQKILAAAVSIFDDLRAAEAWSAGACPGWRPPSDIPVGALLSKGIEFFIRDAHWLALTSPDLHDGIVTMVELTRSSEAFRAGMRSGRSWLSAYGVDEVVTAHDALRCGLRRRSGA